MHLNILKCFLAVLDFWMWMPQPPKGDLGRKRRVHVQVPVWVNGVQGMRTEAVGRASLLCAAQLQAESEQGEQWGWRGRREWAVLTPGRTEAVPLPAC